MISNASPSKLIYAGCLSLFLMAAAAAGEKTVIALNPLSAAGELASERELVSEVMQAELSSSQSITLVDRENLHSALKELQLGEQGMVDPDSAKKLGKILGAKYFCSGMLRASAQKSVAIVKLVDIETSTVKMAYANIEKGDAESAGKALARNIEKLVSDMNAEKASSSKQAEESKKAAIPAELKRPVAMVVIPELHIGPQKVIDPAAETELIKSLLEAGFKTIDSEYVTMMRNDPSNKQGLLSDKKTLADYAAKKGAEVLIYGEAISEFGASLDQSSRAAAPESSSRPSTPRRANCSSPTAPTPERPTSPSPSQARRPSRRPPRSSQPSSSPPSLKNGARRTRNEQKHNSRSFSCLCLFHLRMRKSQTCPGIRRQQEWQSGDKLKFSPWNSNRHFAWAVHGLPWRVRATHLHFNERQGGLRPGPEI